jgi:hypothetical protein
MRRILRQDAIWAALLSSRDNRVAVVRVPDIRAGVSWWKRMVGFRARTRVRFGDLCVVMGRTSDHTNLLIVGGPGALEIPSADLPRQFPPLRTRAIVDPWGNTVILTGESVRIGAAA